MKKNWKIILFVLIGISIWLIAPRLIGVEEALKALKRTYWPFILLALLSEILSYAGIAALSKNILKKIGVNLKYRLALKLGFMNAFAIHLFPVGALGASSLDYYFLRRFKIEGNKAILLIVIRTIFIYLGLFLLLVISSGLARVGNRLSFNQQTIVYSAVFIGSLVLFYMVYLYYHTPLYFKRINQLSTIVKKLLAKTQGESFQSKTLDNLGEDLYSSAKLLACSKGSFLISLFYSLIYWLGDLFCLYFVLLSLGHQPNLAVLIFGFTVSFIISIMSCVPGGLGVLEVGLSLILIGFGMPVATVTMGVLVYRLFSFWLVIPVGGLSFVSLTKRVRQGVLESIS